MSTSIQHVTAWEALDSRGNPTVACSITLRGGATGAAIAPSGASTGQFEAVELRDGDHRYDGRGVRSAVRHVRTELADAVLGLDAADQAAVDAALIGCDGTANLSRLGANAVLAVSLATALAAAAAARTPLYRMSDQPPLLPMPMVNVISGGAHAGGLLDVQDFLVVPVGADRFATAIEWCAAVRRATQHRLATTTPTAGLVADEGGVAASLPTNRAALDLLVAGIEDAGLRPGDDITIAIDVAATQLVVGDGYDFKREQRHLTCAGLVDELVGWVDDFPIWSIEDPLSDTDWVGWADASTRLGSRCQLVGDDLFATNPERVARGITEQVANAVLVKPNQNGTLTGTRAVLDQAHAAGYATVLSARSGETEDSWLADLAVGWRAGQIKVGSTTRGERTAKWNRLLQIEHELGASAAIASPTRPANAPPSPR